MDVWGSVSIEDLSRGCDIIKRMAFMPYSNVVFEFTIEFGRVIYYKSRGYLYENSNIDSKLKDMLIDIVDRYNKVCEDPNVLPHTHRCSYDRLKPITQEERLFLISICKEQY